MFPAFRFALIIFSLTLLTFLINIHDIVSLLASSNWYLYSVCCCLHRDTSSPLSLVIGRQVLWFYASNRYYRRSYNLQNWNGHIFLIDSSVHLGLFVAASVSNIQICLEEARSLMYHGIKGCMIPMYWSLLGDLDLNGVHNSASSYRYSIFVYFETDMWSYLRE